MSDNGISIRFQAYTGEGLSVSVAIQADGLIKFNELRAGLERQYPQLGSFSTLLREPPSGSLRPQQYRIAGWMLGQTQDQKSGELLPAVFLYSDLAHLEYSVCTVYHEMLEKLPPSIDWQHAQLVGNAAPPTAKARAMRSWNACDFEIVMMPQFDHKGDPLVTNSGKPKYKFSHVLGYDAPGEAHDTKPDTTPEPPKTPQSPPPTPSGTSSQPTGQGAPPSGAAPRPVQPAGAVKTDTNGKRINTGTASCPQCHAPVGRRHADNCTEGLSVPAGDAGKGEAFSDDPLAKYAKAFSDPSLTLSPDTTALVVEMRQLDKSSGKSMTLTVPVADGEKAIPGQYNFLVGLINKLVTQMGSTDKEMHNKVLSFIFGSAVRSETAPGENAKVLIDRLYAGSAKSGPNQRFHQGTVDSVMEIIGACMYMDSLVEEEELEYAA